jgi:hypothetical protein
MSDPGDTATRDERKKMRRKALVCDQFSERAGRGNTGQAGKETAHKRKIIGSILHERPVVKGGIKKNKIVDIKQCEARSSKQRLKGGQQIPREKQRKNYRYKEWRPYPGKHNLDV